MKIVPLFVAATFCLVAWQRSVAADWEDEGIKRQDEKERFNVTVHASWEANHSLVLANTNLDFIWPLLFASPVDRDVSERYITPTVRTHLLMAKVAIHEAQYLDGANRSTEAPTPCDNESPRAARYSPESR